MPEGIVPAARPPSGALAVLLTLQSAAPGLPHDREIVLLQCDVRGTTHVPDIAEIDSELPPGTRLGCMREPMNVADEMAIRVDTLQGRKLGYLPRERNEVIARLMDAGKLVSARVQSKEWRGTWLRISIEVVLHDL